VELGPDVSLAVIDPDQTDLCVPAPQVSEEILWLVVPEESVKMMLTVPPHRHASTSNAKIPAKTLVELKLSANQSITVLSALVLMDMLAIR